MSNSPNALTHTHNLQVHTSQVVVIYTQWNDAIINELLAGCKRILDEFSNKISYTLLQVPGCVEIPFAIKQHYEKTKYHCKTDAYIAFGCVIRGETAHFDYVCNSVTDGITQLNVSINAPTIYGILTVNSIEQALDRIGGKHGHKGEEAAITAIQMIDFVRGLK